MRIVVGGCRNFSDYELIERHLDRLLAPYDHSGIVFLSGHCAGVDLLAERYAKEHALAVELYPANWKRYGRAAGPIRNEEMVIQADCVVAFWDGASRGTKSLISYAQKQGKELHIISI